MDPPGAPRRLTCPKCAHQFEAPPSTAVTCPRCHYSEGGPGAGSWTSVPGGLVPPPTPTTIPEFLRVDETQILPIDGRGTSWQRKFYGIVRPGSGRGVWATVLGGLIALLLFLGPIIQLVLIPLRGLPSTEGVNLTSGLIVFNMLINAILFVAIPLGYLGIIYPGRFQVALAELRMGVNRYSVLMSVVGMGLMFGLMIVFGGIIEGLVILELIAEPEISPLILQLQDELTWTLVILIPIAAGVTEEIFFRGILQPRVGLVASSLLFGVVHIGYGTWLQVVAPVVLGFFFGILYLRTRSLWAPISAHFLFDLINLVALKLDVGT